MYFTPVGGDLLNYEELLEDAKNDNILVLESVDFSSEADGLINGDVIGLNSRIIANSHKACVLAEELGHYYTSVGNILEQTDTTNRKQERIARLWAYDKMIGLPGIISGYRAHCQNRHEFAEYLGVTEEFLQEAINCYREKYGVYVNIDGYTIFFEPSLAVMERF